ncbi:hypothetical protein HNQ93_003657 [Hymenobacter luteus]|uniref:Uncharacterized protein n=2 Tax=Hymenobacter TaxID=89966 RepID=A0A7W9T391_9BACT|nr:MULTISPECIES: hypothetical protein [Hymenobacter]MBB4602890.1 hypothetical protein [Hymenobacter latericoloratus]MBB6060782.1 hypothetical protein [Hymenobacter luteus]
MNNPEFHQAIRRIRRLHWVHFPAQALLMTSVVLLASRGVEAGQPTRLPAASWPVLILLSLLIPVVGALLWWLYRRMRPNLRRRSEENLRIYQSRLILRNSLLNLLSLPLLVSYFLTRSPWELVAGGGLLLVLCLLTAPSARAYQRWLLS